MNKRAIIIATVFLVLFVIGTASVFADDRTLEYEYTVSVTYQPSGTTSASARVTKTYYVWASSHSEAMDIAERMCKGEIGAGTVVACGFAQPTGRSRPR